MITRITSKDNVVIKKMKQLESKKFRDKTGMFVLEGITVVSEAFNTDISLELAVYSDTFATTMDSMRLVAKLQSKGVPTYSMDDRLFSLISGTETPQGIMVAARKPDWKDSFIWENQKNIIVLDRVADPGNMGTIIRTAEAAGFGGIIVMKGCVDPYSGKVSRSAAGSLMRLPIAFIETPKDLEQTLRSAKKEIVCTDPKSDLNFFDVDIAYNKAIVIGNEANGVCDEIMKMSDYNVGIPMEGKTESLNAAIASSILMYESLRQRILNV